MTFRIKNRLNREDKYVASLELLKTEKSDGLNAIKHNGMWKGQKVKIKYSRIV